MTQATLDLSSDAASDATYMVTPDMSASERRVWYVLRSHPGADMAIKVEDLAEAVGMGARHVQRIVRSLIHRHAKPVGTSMGERPGYFYATDPAEREAVAKLFRVRALGMLATAAKIRGVTADEEVRRLQVEIAV